MRKATSRLHGVFLAVILITGLMLRISYLESVPPGLTMDEVSIGYNAFTLRTLGTDQDGNRLPLGHIRSLGDYKLPFHIYLVSVSQMIFGNSIQAIRIPGALLSAATTVTTFLIARFLFGTTTALIAALFFAVSPWSVFHARLGLETNTALFLFTLAFYFLLKSIKRRQYLLIASVFTILTLYTHHVYWVFLPPLLLLFLVTERKQIILDSKIFILSLALIALSTLPFIRETKTANTTRLNQSFFSQKNMTKLKEEGGPMHVAISFATHATYQYMNAFSLLVWYAPTGFDTVDVLPMRGLFYAIEFPLLLVGLLAILTLRDRRKTILIGWLLLYPLPLVVTGNLSAARMIQLLPLPQIIAALGLHVLAMKYKIAAPFVLVALVYSLSRLSSDLFFVYPFKYSMQTDYGYIAVRQYIQKNPSNNYYINESLLPPLHVYYFYSIFPDNITPKSIDPGGTIVTQYKNIYIVKRDFLPPSSAQSVLISRNEDMPLSFYPVDEVKLLDKGMYALVSKPRIRE